jgi:hypothetical protein
MVLNFLNEMDSVDNYFSYELSDMEKSLFLEYYILLPETFKTCSMRKFW